MQHPLPRTQGSFQEPATFLEVSASLPYVHCWKNGDRSMSSVANKVLSTVNASYRVNLSADQLALKISDFSSVKSFDASAFSFYSEIGVGLQLRFLDEMAIDRAIASKIAEEFSELAGYRLALSP